MKEITYGEKYRGYTRITVLWIALLALVMFVSVAGAAPFAYITNSGSNNVSVIDTATNNVTTTVNVGSAPFEPFGVAVSPDGTKVYVTNINNINYSIPGFVSVIDTATNNVTATVPVEIGPGKVAVSPDGKKVYVTNNNSSTVSVIDTATNNVTATVPVGIGPGGVAVSPDGKKVYVLNSHDNTTSIIDTATNKVIATVNLEGDTPFGVAISPDGKKVYVTNVMGPNVLGNSTNISSGNISVIDTATNNVTTITPKVLTNEPDLTLSATINNATNTATVNLGFLSFDVAVNPAGTKAYVTNWNLNFEHFGSGTVFVIDTTTYNVTKTVNVGMLPMGIAVTPDGRKAYVANTGSNNVSVIDTTTNNIIAVVNVGIAPTGVAIGPDRM